MRLSKTDVRTLASAGLVTETIFFGKTNIVYELRTVSQTKSLHADFSGNRITVSMPEDFARSWDENDVVGIEEKQDIGNDNFLTLLVEKDFQCVDETTEDQSDNYANPNKVC